jgi:hypothetical protein
MAWGVRYKGSSRVGGSTWCVALRERRGASASGVDLVQLERAMGGGTWAWVHSAEKRSGVESLATCLVTHRNELGHACQRATFTESVPCDVAWGGECGE